MIERRCCRADIGDINNISQTFIFDRFIQITKENTPTFRRYYHTCDILYPVLFSLFYVFAQFSSISFYHVIFNQKLCKYELLRNVKKYCKADNTNRLYIVETFSIVTSGNFE